MDAPQPTSSIADQLDVRISVLEERTRQKPKSLREKFNDWGGITSLIIALGYSFPLGLWDRFIEPERVAAVQELAHLRTVVDESIDILSSGGRALAGIQDPYLYDTVGRAFNTRLFVLMKKNADAFARRKKDFTAPELLVIGNNFSMINEPGIAKNFFVAAKEKSGDDYQARAEALRQLAKISFLENPDQKKAARQLFSESLATMEKNGSLQARISHATLSSEWGFFEIFAGDWACGQRKMQEAIEKLHLLSPVLNDQGNMVKMIQQRLAAQRKQLGQPENGCDGNS